MEKHVGARETPGSANTYKTGISFGAGVRYALRDWLAGQAELLYATRGSDVDVNDRTIGTYYFTYLELPVLVRIRFPFQSEPVRPPWSAYALFGPSVSYLAGAVSEDGAGRNDVPRDALHAFDFGVVGGLGVAWEVTPEWVVSLEARYDRGFTDAFPDIRESKNQAFLVALGVDFTLGHGNRDGDLVADYQDRCLTRDEDENGYQDDDGCPDAYLDGDNDGVFAENDQCPDEVEDKNGYEDGDGCPDADIIDTDKDGIADVVDKCDDEAFGFNRDVPLDRVPEALRERVPGCLPALSVRVERDHGRNRDWLVLKQPLLFDPGQEDIQAHHRDTLNDVALLLEWYYPTLRLQVVGHTDIKSGRPSLIKDRENVRESLRRAKGARDYLMEKGIACDRLEVVGQGDKEPIDQKYGENPMNRRVEFIITDKPATGTCNEENAAQ